MNHASGDAFGLPLIPVSDSEDDCAVAAAPSAGHLTTSEIVDCESGDSQSTLVMASIPVRPV